MKMLAIDTEARTCEDLFIDLRCCCDALAEIREDLASEERWEQAGADENVTRRLIGKAYGLGAVVRHIEQIIERGYAGVGATMMNQELQARQPAKTRK